MLFMSYRFQEFGVIIYIEGSRAITLLIAMINNSISEASIHGFFENGTNSSKSFEDANEDNFKYLSKRFIGFGVASLFANVSSLGLFRISITVGKSIKIAVQSLIANDIVLNLCFLIYGIIASEEPDGNLKCSGFVYTVLATTLNSYMTTSLLAFFNYCAVSKPAQFKKLASIKRTIVYIVCMWLVSWGIAFGSDDWPSDLASCNVHNWFTKSRALILVVILKICICLVFLFNVKVMFELCKDKNNRVSASQTVSENVEVTANNLSNPREPQISRNLHLSISDNIVELPLNISPFEIQPASRGWKNDPRRLLTSSPSLPGVDGAQREPMQISLDTAPASSSSTRSSRFRRTNRTLIILTLVPSLLTLPTLIYFLVLATVQDKQAPYLKHFRVTQSTCLLINYLSNPILHAWRLVGWSDVKKKVASCWKNTSLC